MIENRRAALDYVMEVFEDGTVNEHEPASVGGVSKWGVTLFDYADFCRGKGDAAPTADDIRNLTEDRAREVYEFQFVDKIRFDDLPSGVDFQLLNFAINVGPTGGVRLLHVATGTWPVGDVATDALIAAAGTMDPRALVGAVTGAWLGLKYAGEEWPRYGHGWSNRAKASVAKALTMVKP